MWFCPACNLDIDDSVKNCPKCNLPIPSSHENASGSATPAGTATPADPAGTATAELIVWKYSPKAFRAWAILNWIITFILVGLGIYLSVSERVKGHEKITWGVLAILIAIAWLVYVGEYFYKTNFICYRLTAAHLYSEKGFFHRTIDTMELLTINDLRMKQTLFDRIINGGVGTVEVHSLIDKTDGTLNMVGMENPRDVLEKIDAARKLLRGRAMVQI